MGSPSLLTCPFGRSLHSLRQQKKRTSRRSARSADQTPRNFEEIRTVKFTTPLTEPNFVMDEDLVIKLAGTRYHDLDSLSKHIETHHPELFPTYTRGTYVPLMIENLLLAKLDAILAAGLMSPRQSSSLMSSMRAKGYSRDGSLLLLGLGELWKKHEEALEESKSPGGIKVLLTSRRKKNSRVRLWRLCKTAFPISLSTRIILQCQQRRS